MTGAALQTDDRLARGRARVEDGPSELRIVVPAKRNVFVMLFLSAWLVGWALGWVAAATSLTGEGDFGGGLFVVAWLVGWTLAGLAAMFAVAWMAVGREEALVREGHLLVVKRVGPFARTHRFDVGRVERVRADSERLNLMDPRTQWRFWGIGGGMVAFDYGARTHRFGAGLDDPEARQLATLVEDRLR